MISTCSSKIAGMRMGALHKISVLCVNRMQAELTGIMHMIQLLNRYSYTMHYETGSIARIFTTIDSNLQIKQQVGLVNRHFIIDRLQIVELDAFYSVCSYQHTKHCYGDLVFIQKCNQIQEPLVLLSLVSKNKKLKNGTEKITDVIYYNATETGKNSK